MKCHLVLIVATMFLLASPGIFAQQASANSSDDVGYWVAYWGRPRVALFGPEEQAFNESMHEVMFARDDSNDPTDPEALDNDVRWLKDHPSYRFYVQGYASSRGNLIYNLALSQRRATWVKETLVSRGIPENRIVLAVGWGQLYPVCPELTDECWAKNRLVRFLYSPN
jgi:outer membrane protein OmpA-like peptidoglycan-associated protein